MHDKKITEIAKTCSIEPTQAVKILATVFSKAPTDLKNQENPKKKEIGKYPKSSDNTATNSRPVSKPSKDALPKGKGTPNKLMDVRISQIAQKKGNHDHDHDYTRCQQQK